MRAEVGVRERTPYSLRSHVCQGVGNAKPLGRTETVQRFPSMGPLRGSQCERITMDSLDLKIVREMGFRPYGNRPQDPEAFKPSYLAKRTGVEPETVKARLARMEETGFIRFYQVYPNFRHELPPPRSAGERVPVPRSGRRPEGGGDPEGRADRRARGDP